MIHIILFRNSVDITMLKLTMLHMHMQFLSVFHAQNCKMIIKQANLYLIGLKDNYMKFSFMKIVENCFSGTCVMIY